MPIKTTQPGDEQRRRVIGARIRGTRIQAGIGLRQMARDLGMSPSSLLSVEAGENGLDAVRLADIGRYLGYPASYFLDEPDYVVQRQRQLMSRPATRLDWQLMYDGEGERARAHFEVDRVFERLEEASGAGGTGPAGGD
ncbi:MAG: helix-turn-helix domain-containing protein [Hyphomicrobiales bacterium]